jgi:hypothetical protein
MHKARVRTTECVHSRAAARLAFAQAAVEEGRRQQHCHPGHRDAPARPRAAPALQVVEPVGRGRPVPRAKRGSPVRRGKGPGGRVHPRRGAALPPPGARQAGGMRAAGPPLQTPARDHPSHTGPGCGCPLRSRGLQPARAEARGYGTDTLTRAVYQGRTARPPCRPGGRQAARLPATRHMPEARWRATGKSSGLTSGRAGPAIFSPARAPSGRLLGIYLVRPAQPGSGHRRPAAAALLLPPAGCPAAAAAVQSRHFHASPK